MSVQTSSTESHNRTLFIVHDCTPRRKPIETFDFLAGVILGVFFASVGCLWPW